eukprot:260785-Rhodomonas_salina.2
MGRRESVFCEKDGRGGKNSGKGAEGAFEGEAKKGAALTNCTPQHGLHSRAGCSFGTGSVVGCSRGADSPADGSGGDRTVQPRPSSAVHLPSTALSALLPAIAGCDFDLEY